MKADRYYCRCCKQPLPKARKNLQPELPMSLWNPDGPTLGATPKLPSGPQGGY